MLILRFLSMHKNSSLCHKVTLAFEREQGQCTCDLSAASHLGLKEGAWALEVGGRCGESELLGSTE